MTKARKYQVDPNVSAHYHVTDRCVQKMFLMGVDPYTQQSYEHRKFWIVERLRYLSKIFIIEIGGYSIMDNHYHLLVKTRPDLLKLLTDEEVLDRWFNLCPPKFKPSATPREQKIKNLKALYLKDREYIKEIRVNIGSLSCFMKVLNQNIARRANREMGTTGSFWQSRFHCKMITSAEVATYTQTYIDLNPIRAGIAETPETAKFTSAHDRIEHRQNRKKVREALQVLRDQKQDKKTSLRDTNPEAVEKFLAVYKGRNRTKWLASFYKGEFHTRPFFRITEEEYFDLLDCSGREIRADKPGAIPASLAPIFDRLEIDCQQWVESLKAYDTNFYRVVGKMSKAFELLKHTTNRWFKGACINRKIFGD